MVLLLSGDISPHRFDLRESNGENPVTILPGKVAKARASGLDPQRGSAFDLLDHLCRRAGARQGAQEMNMVFDTANNNRLALEMGQYPAEVPVEFFAQGSVAQKWTTVLC